MNQPEPPPQPALPASMAEMEQYLADMEAGFSEAERQHGHSLRHLPGLHNFYGVVPVFLVDDIVGSCEYYQSVLGFEVDFTYGDPADFACVSRDNVMINFLLASPAGIRNSARGAGSNEGADAYILVSRIDEVFQELKERGAAIVREPASRPYGMREFQVEDCNGYRLTLADGSLG